MNRLHTSPRMAFLLLAVLAPGLWLAWSAMHQADAAPIDHAISVKIESQGVTERIDLRRRDDGSYEFLANDGTAHPAILSPDELADRLYRQQFDQPWLHRLFNISTAAGVIWVTLGLLGQVLFTGRMIVQWLASERRRQSVVPPIFWWLSLIGAAMLLTYFIWRRDIVGVLGQSFGVVVYLRNLTFIYGRGGPVRLESLTDAPRT